MNFEEFFKAFKNKDDNFVNEIYSLTKEKFKKYKLYKTKNGNYVIKNIENGVEVNKFFNINEAKKAYIRLYFSIER
jgi:hypothetical protein